MKQFSKIILLPLIAATISCTSESSYAPSFGAPTVSECKAEITKTTKYVTLSANITSPSQVSEAGFYVSEDESMSSIETRVIAKVSDRISSKYLPGGYGKTYYYKAFISNGVSEKCSKIGSFKTEDFGYYVNLASTIESMTETTATVRASLTVANGITPSSKGFCYGEKENVTIEDNVMEVTSSEFKAEVPYSEGTYVRAFVRDGDDVAYSPIATKVTIPDVVDLGLSVKWASFNVGASKPEEYGGYYQWAGTKDVSNTNIDLDWDNCPYSTESDYITWTKYNTKSSYGTVDNKTVLEPGDDAAQVNWGGSWRMPSDAECTELRENCTWTWTTKNGVNGYLVTSNKTGYTNKSIFLPASGDRCSDELLGVGTYGSFWSSSLNNDDPRSANTMYFDWSNAFVSRSYRCDGHPVRPVSE